MNYKLHGLPKLLFLLFCCVFISCQAPHSFKDEATEWPPKLPGSDYRGIGTLSGSELLKIPVSVQNIVKQKKVQLIVAKTAPTIELVYHKDLPDAALNGTGWSSWGNICVASDNTVYMGIGNHGGVDKGEAYIYSWKPDEKELTKIVDINQVSEARPGDIRFSKVHAHIVEGTDKMIYFIGTLDDGGKAGSRPIVDKWNERIGGAKIFQYNPKTDETIVFADFPKARVASKLKYCPERNLLYCPLEGHPLYKDGFALGVFDMTRKEWIYEGTPGQLQSINIMLDDEGNLYYQGKASFIHLRSQLEGSLSTLKNKEVSSNQNDPNEYEQKLFEVHNFLKDSSSYITIWKYDPNTNTVTPTNSFLENDRFSDPADQLSTGWIYGTTEKGKIFRYHPRKDQLEIMGSNFLADGEFVTASVLSPDEKFLYYLPRAHGEGELSSGTPIVQYDINRDEIKILAFLLNPMNEEFRYAPGGSYGIEMNHDGTTLYINLNGAPSDSLRPSGLGPGFGLTSFAIVQIPESERQ